MQLLFVRKQSSSHVKQHWATWGLRYTALVIIYPTHLPTDISHLRVYHLPSSTISISLHHSQGYSNYARLGIAAITRNTNKVI